MSWLEVLLLILWFSGWMGCLGYVVGYHRGSMHQMKWCELRHGIRKQDAKTFVNAERGGNGGEAA